MQKKLIALAVAGLVSGGALAQAANVTMYGVLDANVNWIDSGFGRKMAVGTGGLNATRFGFRGSEDLGGGTKAVFALEAGFSMDTQSMGVGAPTSPVAGVYGGINNTNASTGGAPGNGPMIFSRQGFVGLDGPWGVVHLGRLYTATYIGTAIVADPAVGGLYAGPGNVTGTGLVPRVNNGITYKTPNLNGFYGWFTYSAGAENNVNGTVAVPAAPTTNTNDRAGRGYDLAGLYSNGPFNAIVSTWNFNRASWAAGEFDLAKQRGYLIAGNYDFKAIKLYGAFLGAKIDGGNYENVTKAFSKTRTYTLGAIIPTSAAGRILVNYESFDDQSSLNKDFKAWGVAYLHDLSKRTTLYADYGKLSNNAASTQPLLTGGDLTGSVNAPGADPSAFMMGVRHTF